MKNEKQQIAEELSVTIVRLKLIGEDWHAATLEGVVEDLIDTVTRERVAMEEEEETVEE